MKTLASHLSAIGIGLLITLGLFAPAPAHAWDEAPTQPMAATVEYGYRYTPEGQLTAIHLIVTGAPTGTTAGISVVGCDAHTTGATVSNKSGDFEVVLPVVHMQRSLGARIPTSVALSAAGYETVRIDETIQHPFLHVGEANCTPAANPQPPRQPLVTAKVLYTGAKLYNGGAYTRMYFRAKHVQPGTKIVVKGYASCKAKKAFATKVTRKGGKFSLFGKSRGFNKRSYYYTARITKPGKKAKFIVTRPSCYANR